MKRAVLFLLITCLVASLALAQTDGIGDFETQESLDTPEAIDDVSDNVTDTSPLAEEKSIRGKKTAEEEQIHFQLQKSTKTEDLQTPENSKPLVKTEIIQPETGDKTEVPEISSAADPKNYTNQVILRGLNKITARTSTIKVALGESVKFGNLSIILHACWKSPPEEELENKTLLEVWEEIPKEPRKRIFSGWMFSSSPLISAPEHPVYDITVIECKD